MDELLMAMIYPIRVEDIMVRNCIGTSSWLVTILAVIRIVVLTKFAGIDSKFLRFQLWLNPITVWTTKFHLTRPCPWTLLGPGPWVTRTDQTGLWVTWTNLARPSDWTCLHNSELDQTNLYWSKLAIQTDSILT